MAGSPDSAHELYLARGAELPGLVATGEITGAATIIGAQHTLLTARQRTH